MADRLGRMPVRLHPDRVLGDPLHEQTCRMAKGMNEVFKTAFLIADATLLSGFILAFIVASLIEFITKNL